MDCRFALLTLILILTRLKKLVGLFPASLRGEREAGNVHPAPFGVEGSIGVLLTAQRSVQIMVLGMKSGIMVGLG